MKQSKTSKRWLQEHFSDPFVKQAHDKGFRSRAYFKIEEIDKKGKLLFKNKQYFEAAEAFTEALNLIETKKKSEVDKDSVTSSSLNRQLVTLLNNRSAMYEKADLPDLALIGMYTSFLFLFEP